MLLPISFEEVAYFNNEYRGDLIVAKGVIYYFPHTRVTAARYSEELGARDKVEIIGLAGMLVPILGVAPWLYVTADKSFKFFKFLKRSFRPTINLPRIRESKLWLGGETSEELQNRLDNYIVTVKQERLNFADDAVPKPTRFTLDDMKDISFGWKFKFAAKFDTHDFRVNPLHRKLLKKALEEGGFLN